MKSVGRFQSIEQVLYEYQSEMDTRTPSRGPEAAAVTDRVVDDLFCLGTADEVAAKVAAYVDAGVTVPVLAPLTFGRGPAEATLWAIADAWR
jgi:alkanesulfonate monooxygenase SsuD/methylene tetrahydromethanopterin reductase-like flavin-dependent oxidoreductase (luciferase family)